MLPQERNRLCMKARIRSRAARCFHTGSLAGVQRFIIRFNQADHPSRRLDNLSPHLCFRSAALKGDNIDPYQRGGWGFWA